MVPEFQLEWEEEYQTSSFQPREMLLVCLISTVYYFAHFFAAVFGRGVDEAGGDLNLIVVTWLPELVFSIASGTFFVLLCSQRARPFVVPLYSRACALAIVLAYLASILPSVALEVRRSRFQAASPGHVRWTLNYSSFPPARACADADPLSTLVDEQSDTAGSGCNSLVLSGSAFCSYVLWNLLPRICRMDAAPAAAAAAATALILVAAASAVGAQGWPLLACAAFQLAMGLGAAHFCRVREAAARAQFAVVKGTKFAAEQNRNLLFTLYPRNVVDRLASQGPATGPGPLCQEIDVCTVMFCSLEPQVRPAGPSESAGPPRRPPLPVCARVPTRMRVRAVVWVCGGAESLAPSRPTDTCPCAPAA